MRTYLLGILLLLFTPSAYSQLQDGSLPVSLHTGINVSPASFDIARPNIDSLEKADITEAAAGLPPRFGFAVPLNKGLKDCTIQSTDKGKIYLLRITAPGATSINLNFSEFYLPEDARMWAYTPGRSRILGAFTASNMNPDGNFATMPISTEEIWIEYFVPSSAASAGKWVVSEVVYGYKDAFGMDGFGSSAACNVNVNCPEAAGWENEVNATVMLLTAGNVRKCSGTLMNNTAGDATPYILTARHCNTLTNAIFMFGYQSPDCSNINGPVDMVLQGCQVMAENPYSDFTLLKLNQQPPPEFNPYYAGWDRRDIPSPMAYCIHHPSGDVKKFSVDSHAVVSSGYLPLPDTGVVYWKVEDWDLGTTEGGSSGSPLFNTSHQVIGQLRGGLASCNNDLQDYYGKLHYSWDYGTTPESRLKEWLDPLNSNVTDIPGGLFISPAFQRDIRLYPAFGYESYLCGDTQKVQVPFMSLGSDTVYEFTYSVSTGSDMIAVYTWTGQLVFLQGDTLELALHSFPEGTNGVEIRVLSVNQSNDENDANDFSSFVFTKGQGLYYHLEILTDNYPAETSIELRNENDSILDRYENFQPATLHHIDFCRPIGCFKLRINDSQGDGICCGFGNGYYLLKNDAGDTLAYGAEFLFFNEHTICKPLIPKGGALFKIFPNPVQDVVQIMIAQEWFGKDLTIDITDYHGRKIYEEQRTASYINTFQLPGLRAGVYILRIREALSGKEWTDKILVISR